MKVTAMMGVQPLFIRVSQPLHCRRSGLEVRSSVLRTARSLSVSLASTRPTASCPCPPPPSPQRPPPYPQGVAIKNVPRHRPSLWRTKVSPVDLLRCRAHVPCQCLGMATPGALLLSLNSIAKYMKSDYEKF